MGRMTRIALASLLALVVLPATACQRRVEVQTGTRIECTYGHVITDNIRTREVPAKDAAKYQARTIKRVCAKHEQIAQLYSDAQAALAKGDTATAKKKLEQVVALEATFGQASTQLDTIAQGKKPAPDSAGGSQSGGGSSSGGGSGSSGGNGGSKTPGEGDTATPQGQLTRWTPDAIAGYTAAKPAIDVLNVAREYVPANANRILLVIVAEQQRTAEGAQSALQSKVKGAYAQDAETLTINGRKAYFGTDGKRYAAIGFTEGAVMVALELSDKETGSPERMKSELVAAAKKLP